MRNDNDAGRIERKPLQLRSLFGGELNDASMVWTYQPESVRPWDKSVAAGRQLHRLCQIGVL